MKSLQWLRGWVSPAAVSDEFKDLQRYNAMASSCLSCEKLVTKCEHPPPTLLEKVKDIGRKRTLKPFILVAFQCFIMQFCGIFAMRPYIVQVDIVNRLNQCYSLVIEWIETISIDPECLRSAIGCEFNHRDTWIARHCGQRWTTGDG